MLKEYCEKNGYILTVTTCQDTKDKIIQVDMGDGYGYKKRLRMDIIMKSLPSDVDAMAVLERAMVRDLEALKDIPEEA